MTPVTPRQPIERRLADAGLPALPRLAWLEIDLDALRDNLAALRVLAGPGVPVRPVVKADAYGHGAVPVALALEAAGADGFCVAAFDEAIELREGGVRAPILVLYPVPAMFAAEAARRDIAVAAGDRAGLAATIDAAAQLDPGRPLRVELEIETGLGRGGFSVSEVTAAARDVAASRGLQLAGLWTHFQAAHDRGDHGCPGRRLRGRGRGDPDGRDRAPDAPRGRQRGAPHRRHAGLRRRAPGAGGLWPRPR